MKYETPDLLEVAKAEALILGDQLGEPDSGTYPNDKQIVAEVGLDM